MPERSRACAQVDYVARACRAPRQLGTEAEYEFALSPNPFGGMQARFWRSMCRLCCFLLHGSISILNGCQRNRPHAQCSQWHLLNATEHMASVPSVMGLVEMNWCTLRHAAPCFAQGRMQQCRCKHLALSFHTFESCVWRRFRNCGRHAAMCARLHRCMFVGV